MQRQLQLTDWLAGLFPGEKFAITPASAMPVSSLFPRDVFKQ